MKPYYRRSQKATPRTRVLNTRSEEKLIKFRNLWKKEKFAQHVFRTFFVMTLQISLHAQGPIYAKKINQRYFSRTSKIQKHGCNLHEINKIDKKSNRKSKRLPMIPVTYAILTILVSFNEIRSYCFPCYCACNYQSPSTLSNK